MEFQQTGKDLKYANKVQEQNKKYEDQTDIKKMEQFNEYMKQNERLFYPITNHLPVPLDKAPIPQIWGYRKQTQYGKFYFRAFLQYKMKNERGISLGIRFLYKIEIWTRDRNICKPLQIMNKQASYRVKSFFNTVQKDNKKQGRYLLKNRVITYEQYFRLPTTQQDMAQIKEKVQTWACFQEKIFKDSLGQVSEMTSLDGRNIEKQKNQENEIWQQYFDRVNISSGDYQVQLILSSFFQKALEDGSFKFIHNYELVFEKRVQIIIGILYQIKNFLPQTGVYSENQLYLIQNKDQISYDIKTQLVTHMQKQQKSLRFQKIAKVRLPTRNHHKARIFRLRDLINLILFKNRSKYPIAPERWEEFCKHEIVFNLFHRTSLISQVQLYLVNTLRLYQSQLHMI